MSSGKSYDDDDNRSDNENDDEESDKKDGDSSTHCPCNRNDGDKLSDTKVAQKIAIHTVANSEMMGKQGISNNRIYNKEAPINTMEQRAEK